VRCASDVGNISKSAVTRNLQIYSEAVTSASLSISCRCCSSIQDASSLHYVVFLYVSISAGQSTQDTLDTVVVDTQGRVAGVGTVPAVAVRNPPVVGNPLVAGTVGVLGVVGAGVDTAEGAGGRNSYRGCSSLVGERSWALAYLRNLA